MPEGCRFMSDDKTLLPDLLRYGKFILNKTITGCGGTSLFINSYIPTVIISPRIQALKDKHEQHPDTFLFHTRYKNSNRRAEDIIKLMSDLNTYLNQHQETPFNHNRPAKILVTLDSCSKVIDILKSHEIADSFIYVVDEFQCLMSDAAFKGNTDMNFLIMLDSNVKHICYLSATPIQDIYLDFVPEFKGLPYIKLEWDPNVIEEPNVMEIQMKKEESAEKICGEIIQYFRTHEYFARKLINGRPVYAREACFYLNDVRSITNIIQKNDLKPNEVTILCSDSKTLKLSKKFKTGRICTDRKKPMNTTFTFCTKASFEGLDFYSTNAITYIFINAGQIWQTLDIMLDIPQILGRQRLDCNPFRYDATIYYKTKPDCQTTEEFKNQQNMMEAESESFINDYKNAPETLKAKIIKLVSNIAEDKKFTDDYIDTLEIDGKTTIGINHLVQVAKWNQWHQRNFYYKNSCQLISSIRSAISMKEKPNEVKEFEDWYYANKDRNRLRGYSDFRNTYPQYYGLLQRNPFINICYHVWYDTLGYQKLAELKFDEADVEEAYWFRCNHTNIVQACQFEFTHGHIYSKSEVKKKLQKIYDSNGIIGKKAKALELQKYLNIRKRMITDSEGNRKEHYEILA